MLELQNLKFLSFLVLAGLVAIFSLFLLANGKVMADEFSVASDQELSNFSILEETTLVSLGPVPTDGNSEVARKIRVIVTAYSSSVWETQGDPFITASGSRVRDGIVANNLLKFGTKVRLPEIFGDKIFVVGDRMNSKKGYYHVDVWFPSRALALNFGAKLTEMEVLAY